MNVEDFASYDPLPPVKMTAVCPDGPSWKIESGLFQSAVCRPVLNTRVQIGTTLRVRYVTNAESFILSVPTQYSATSANEDNSFRDHIR
jgi:hypothetical protein